jgi:hypothetical protein
LWGPPGVRGSLSFPTIPYGLLTYCPMSFVPFHPSLPSLIAFCPTVPNSIWTSGCSFSYFSDCTARGCGPKICGFTPPPLGFIPLGWPPKIDAFFDRFWCRFWCRFGCLLGSILAPKLAQVRSKIALGHLSFSKTSFSLK